MLSLQATRFDSGMADWFRKELFQRGVARYLQWGSLEMQARCFETGGGSLPSGSTPKTWSRWDR